VVARMCAAGMVPGWMVPGWMVLTADEPAKWWRVRMSLRGADLESVVETSGMAYGL